MENKRKPYYTEIEGDWIIRLAVTIDRESEVIEDMEFITRDISVFDPSDFYD